MLRIDDSTSLIDYYHNLKELIMGSTTEGSQNVAEQITNDCTGQIVTFNGDATSQASGLVLTSANGTEYKLSVSDIGALTAEAV